MDEDRGTYKILCVTNQTGKWIKVRHCTNLVRPGFLAITQHAFTHYACITYDARESTDRLAGAWPAGRGVVMLCNPHAGTSSEKVLDERS